VVLDLVMPGLDGMGVLAKIREAGLSIPVVVQTRPWRHRQCGVGDARRRPGFCGQAGRHRAAAGVAAQCTQHQRAEGRAAAHQAQREGRLTFADIITRSETMAGVLRTAQKAAASTIPVLIEGESGVGKELFARAIHGSGERKSKPFVAVNCGAIPDNLVESILFGHEKGAFTGATERIPANSSRLAVERCSSTKSANCRWPRR